MVFVLPSPSLSLADPTDEAENIEVWAEMPKELKKFGAPNYGTRTYGSNGTTKQGRLWLGVGESKGHLHSLSWVI